MNLSEEEIFAFNTGLKQAQWQVTKMMLTMQAPDELGSVYSSLDIHTMLKFIRDEIEKEKK